MQSVEDLTQKESGRCKSCAMRDENLRAIGLAIFFPSLFSCGLLLPFSLMAAGIIQSLSFRKCKECRERAKNERSLKYEAR